MEERVLAMPNMPAIILTISTIILTMITRAAAATMGMAIMNTQPEICPP